MQPETGGEFTVFNYPEYIYGKLLKDFGQKYNVTVKVTPFDDINSGVQRLASGAVQPDVTEMTPDNLDRVVAIIVNNERSVPLTDARKAPFDAAEIGKRFTDGVALDSKSVRDRNRRSGVERIVPAWHRQSEFVDRM